MASPELEPRTVTASGSGRLRSGYTYSWSVELEPSPVAKTTIAGILRRLDAKLRELDENVARLESWLRSITVYEVSIDPETGRVRAEKRYGPGSPTLERLVSSFSRAAEKLASLNPGGIEGGPYVVARRVLDVLNTYASWRKRFSEMLVKLYDLGGRGALYRLGDTHTYAVLRPDQLLELDERYSRLKSYGLILARVSRGKRGFVLETYTVAGVGENGFKVTNPGAAEQAGIDARALLEGIESSMGGSLGRLERLEREYLRPLARLVEAGLGALAGLLAYAFRGRIAEATLLYNNLASMGPVGGRLCRYYSGCDKVVRSLGFEPYIVVVIDDSWLERLRGEIETVRGPLEQLSSRGLGTVELVAEPGGAPSDKAVRELVKRIKEEHPSAASMGDERLASIVNSILSSEQWLARLTSLLYAPSVELRIDGETVKLGGDVLRVVRESVRGTPVGVAVEKLLGVLGDYGSEARGLRGALVEPIVALASIRSLNSFIDRVEEKVRRGERLSPGEKTLLDILYNCETNIGLLAEKYYSLCIVDADSGEPTLYDVCVNRDSLKAALEGLERALKRLEGGVERLVELGDASLRVKQVARGAEVKEIDYFDDLVSRLVDRLESLCEKLRRKRGVRRKERKEGWRAHTHSSEEGWAPRGARLSHKPFHKHGWVGVRVGGYVCLDGACVGFGL